MDQLNAFTSASKYERQVDIKKLKFIFNAINRYSQEASIPLDQLTILEVGCGDGSISLPLSTLGATVTAFDLDSSLVSGLKRELSTRKIANVFLSCQNAYNFRSEKQFNIAIASEVLEHVDFPEKLVENLKDQIVLGGYFIVTIPNGNGPWELRNRFEKIINRNRSKPSECGHMHVHFFSMKRFSNLMADAQFQLVGFGKSDSLSGLSYAVAKNRVLAKVDLALADIMPSWFSSGWYFTFKKMN